MNIIPLLFKYPENLPCYGYIAPTELILGKFPASPLLLFVPNKTVKLCVGFSIFKFYVLKVLKFRY